MLAHLNVDSLPYRECKEVTHQPVIFRHTEGVGGVGDPAHSFSVTFLVFFADLANGIKLVYWCWAWPACFSTCQCLLVWAQKKGMK